MPGFSKYMVVGLALSGAALGHFDDVKRDMPGMPGLPLAGQLTKTDEYLLGKLRTLKHACKEDHESLCSGARGPEALDCLAINAADVSEACADALEGFPLSSCVPDTATYCESFAPMTLGETFSCLKRNFDSLDVKCQAGVLKGLTELGLDAEDQQEEEDQTFTVQTEPVDDEAEEEPEEAESIVGAHKKWKKTRRPDSDSDSGDDDEDCEEDPTTAPPATTGAPATTTAAPVTTTAAPATTTAAPATTTAAPVETTAAVPDEGTGVVLPDPVATAALIGGDSDSNLKKWLKDLKDKKKKKRCKKSSGSDSDSSDDEDGKKKRWRHGFDGAEDEAREGPSFGRVFGKSALAGAGVVGVGIAGVAVARKLRRRRDPAPIEQPSQYQEMSLRV